MEIGPQYSARYPRYWLVAETRLQSSPHQKWAQPRRVQRTRAALIRPWPRDAELQLKQEEWSHVYLQAHLIGFPHH